MNLKRTLQAAALAAAATMAFAACTSQARWVNCKRKLEPINTVVVTTKSTPAPQRSP
jgi:hypothetical protein